MVFKVSHFFPFFLPFIRLRLPPQQRKTLFHFLFSAYLSCPLLSFAILLPVLFHQRIKLPQIKLCPVWGFCRVFIIWTSFADIPVDKANIKSQTSSPQRRYQTMKMKPLIKFWSRTGKFKITFSVDLGAAGEFSMWFQLAMTASVLFDCLKFP